MSRPGMFSEVIFLTVFYQQATRRAIKASVQCTRGSCLLPLLTFFWAFATGEGTCLATTSTNPDADPRNLVKISFNSGLGSR